MANVISKYQLLIGFVALGVIAVIGFALLQQEQLAIIEEGEFNVTAKWKIYATDLLDEGSAAGSGTLAIYDADNPGVPLESGLSISSGVFTTAKEYSSGETVFLKYTDSTYFDYGMLVTFPKWDTDFDTQVTLDLPTEIQVIKMADMPDSGYTDLDGLKNGAQVWDGSAAAVNSFNRTLDGDYPKLGIMVTNEDTETAYVDPRGYFDYSSQNADQRDKKSYLVIEFLLNPGGSAIADVNDYLKFQTWPSGMIKKKMGTSLVVFYPLSSLDAPYLYDVDDDNNPISNKDGNGIIFELTFDFSGSIAGALDGDDIDIDTSIVTGFSQDWFDAKERLTSVSGDDPLGAMAFSPYGWTNDWSIGWA